MVQSLTSFSVLWRESAEGVLNINRCAHKPCGRVVVFMLLPDEFNMKFQFVGGTALGDLAESWYSHHQRCTLKPSGRVVVIMLFHTSST